jgi:hypothetical protein
VPVDDTRVHRAFVYLAPVRISDRSAQHDRSDRRKRECHDDEKRQGVPQPWKSFTWLLHGSTDLAGRSRVARPTPTAPRIRPVIYEFAENAPDDP